jgi:hypothetical protein
LAGVTIVDEFDGGGKIEGGSSFVTGRGGGRGVVGRAIGGDSSFVSGRGAVGTTDEGGDN